MSVSIEGAIRRDWRYRYRSRATRVVRGPSDPSAAQWGAGACGAGRGARRGGAPGSRTGGRPCSHRASSPERELLTGLGPLAVRQPRVRDRGAAAGDPQCHPVLARLCCRRTHGGPGASMCCCRFSTCGACDGNFQ